MAFYRRRNKIRITGETAKSFGIVTDAQKSGKNFYEIEVKKINEDDKQVELFLKIKDLSKNRKSKRRLIISKATLSRKEATLIGWCYIILTKGDSEHKASAKKYLKEAIKDDSKSYFDREKPQSSIPYYLLSKYDLFEPADQPLRLLYEASACKDVFPDFLWELFRREKDKIRKKDIAKRALRQFPKADNESFIDFIISDLLKKGRLKEARKFFEDQIAKISKKAWSEGYQYLKVTIINLLLAQKDFLRGEKVLTEISFHKSTNNLLKGRFYFEKGDYKKAVDYFNEAITSTTTDTDDTQASYYYLLACYTKTQNIPEIQDIIENAKLCHQELTVYYPLDFHYEDLAERTLKNILRLKIDELLRAKVRGLLAYIQTSSLPTQEDVKSMRVLTKKEKRVLKDAENSIKDALQYYPNDKVFNATYSNILYLKKEYDHSLKYKLRALDGIESSQMFLSLQVKMSDASDDFLDRYTEILRDIIDNYSIDIDDYIEHQFNEDAGALYERKKFKSIKDLYTYIKPHINDLASLGESNYYGLWHVGLFELGYALSECGDEKEAKKVYETYLESHSDSSSALNNLAIIYEKEKNIEKAKELIRRAKEYGKEDEIVERNYLRIFSGKTKNETMSQPKQQVQKQKRSAKKTPQTIVERAIGYLLLNGAKIEVGPAKNIPFKLLEALCPIEMKATNAIFNLSSTDRSKFKNEQLSLLEKQDVLRMRIKELQEILRDKKVSAKLIFNESNETVFLKLTRG